MEVAAKNHLVIVNWPKGVTPPGPKFDSKKLCGPGVKEMVEGYMHNVNNNVDDNVVYSVEKWSEGEHRVSLIHSRDLTHSNNSLHRSA